MSILHYAVETPKAQLGMRPVVLAQERSSRLYCRRVNYCQYNHIFAKCMGAEGVEWQRPLQGCDRVLRQEQEGHREDQPKDRAVESQVGHRRRSSQGSQGTNQGRAAEQGACDAAAGAVAGNVYVTAVQGHGGVVTEDMIEAMHRTESVQVATRRRRAGATGFNQNFKNNLLPD